MQAFHVGVLGLGFAAVRPSFVGGLVLPPAVVDVMRVDLEAARRGVTAVSACIAFDPSRFTSLAGRLSGLTGNQATSEVQQLIQDLRQAIRPSGIRCNGIDTAGFESYYNAVLSIGFAEARAAQFGCGPLPAAVDAAIRTDLAAAQMGLRAYAACIPAFDFGIFGNIRLGRPMAIETYVDLIGLEVAVRFAICNSPCCCTCAGGPPPPGVGTVRGTVRNASNAQPIPGAMISVANTNLSTTSGSDGTYTLNNVPAGQQTLNASASGFMPTQVMVTVVANQTVEQNISLSPTLPTGEIRITLNWTRDANGVPSDLDMHLTGPDPDGTSCFHVYYGDRGSLTSAPFAQLEVDNRVVPGRPPTETIRISGLTPGIYRFYVHNFSGCVETEPNGPSGISQSRATVQVFGSSGLLFSQMAPSGTGCYWTVFTLNGQTGAITGVNQLSNTAPSATPCR
ncbi:MAG: carboxypeptidase-like regulatory domain-containing protein [Acidobacteria bacterium]|nr:carboxypeptidase-like regulatory domain-containing protein [Acidobacteriota bacterium]